MLPLEGTTVVAVEQAVAAPFATRQLADLGARIIKIERPGVGDFARGYDSTVKGMASHFVWLNRSKESLTLDLKHPEAVDVLRRLLGQADVFIHNLAPGAMGRLGFGHIKGISVGRKSNPVGLMNRKNHFFDLRTIHLGVADTTTVPITVTCFAWISEPKSAMGIKAKVVRATDA